MRPYKRILVNDMRFLRNLVLYVHQNPVAAGLCRSPAEWPWSSFSDIIKNDSSFVLAAEVIAWFHDLQNFLFVHHQLRKQISSEFPHTG